jgi:hypothetical protein
MTDLDPFDAPVRGAESAPAGVLGTEEALPADKRAELLRLWRSEGQRDLASLTVLLRARPASIVRALQEEGELSETVSAEQLVYARYFRGVLRTDNRRWVVDTIIRLQRLWMYFERLGDRTGQHQVMVMALTGFNRLRWAGRTEEAELFWTFLKGKAHQ